MYSESLLDKCTSGFVTVLACSVGRTALHTHTHTHTQRQQLLRLGVPSLSIAVALDEGPGPPLRSPYTDLNKLYAVVSILVRCCNVSIMQKSSVQASDRRS